jgi:hypothetical protein
MSIGPSRYRATWCPGPPTRTGCVTGVAVLGYKGDRMEEPIRLREWKRANLWHVMGRMRV